MQVGINFIQKLSDARPPKEQKTSEEALDDLVQKAVGGWVREAGKKNLQQLLSFLDKYAATMLRTMLRYAVEHLDKAQREHYLSMKRRLSNS
jgi:3-methyladenine DNA glycosylase AlkD